MKFLSELKEQHFPKMIELTNPRLKFLIASPMCKNLCLNLLTFRNPGEL